MHLLPQFSSAAAAPGISAGMPDELARLLLLAASSQPQASPAPLFFPRAVEEEEVLVLAAPTHAVPDPRAAAAPGDTLRLHALEHSVRGHGLLLGALVERFDALHLCLSFLSTLFLLHLLLGCFRRRHEALREAAGDVSYVPVARPLVSDCIVLDSPPRRAKGGNGGAKGGGGDRADDEASQKPLVLARRSEGV